MSELEEIGIAGPDYLRETLTNCSNPLTAIKEFQKQNSILLPSLAPALHFLDLHSINRVDFNTSGSIIGSSFNHKIHIAVHVFSLLLLQLISMFFSKPMIFEMVHNEDSYGVLAGSGETIWYNCSTRFMYRDFFSVNCMPAC